MNQKKSITSYNGNLTVYEAQNEMRRGHANGHVGVITSGLIWLLSSVVSYQYTPKLAIWSLLIGGTFISPIVSMVHKLKGYSGHSSGNPFKYLAIESTAWMIMCLPIAYGLSLRNPLWFFQAMLLVIGGRYLTFKTLFGDILYWCLGGTLGIAAYILFNLKIDASGTLLTGSIIEIFYGLLLYKSLKKHTELLKETPKK